MERSDYNVFVQKLAGEILESAIIEKEAKLNAKQMKTDAKIVGTAIADGVKGAGKAAGSAGSAYLNAVKGKKGRGAQAAAIGVPSAALLGGAGYAAYKARKKEAEFEDETMEKEAMEKVAAVIEKAADVYNESQMLKQAAIEALLEAQMNEDAAIEVLAETGYFDALGEEMDEDYEEYEDGEEEYEEE